MTPTFDRLESRIALSGPPAFPVATGPLSPQAEADMLLAYPPPAPPTPPGEIGIVEITDRFFLKPETAAEIADRLLGMTKIFPK